MPVVRRDAGPGVDQEQGDRRPFERPERLRRHPVFDRAGRRLFESGRIDNGESKAVQARLRFLAVARHAGRIVHQGGSPAHQPVEQGGFSDVRPADNGDPCLAAAHYRKAVNRPLSSRNSIVRCATAGGIKTPLLSGIQPITSPV